ncbi:hypothetical protein FGB62_68g142 [Gracilaria domingensis]|nr:hypothetical protein FGB62_68g142 [Gracilaria domingensis]
MVATHRTGMSGFIILLAALAFLRSLAPEHTEKAVRGLMKTSNIPNKAIEEERRHLREMKDEIKRERIALERLKEKLDQNPDQEVQQAEEHSFESSGDEGEHSSTETEAVANDTSEESPDEKHEISPTEGNGADQIPDEHESAGEKKKEEIETQEPYNLDHDVDLVELADDECPVVVVPEYSKSGLGTQIEHVWTTLSVTLAVRNACAVLPPIVTDIGEEDVEIVPFQEIFDLHELGHTGLRILPLSVCKTFGVSDVFDDNGAESAIVKNFVSYVERSHPSLAEQTKLVHEDTQAHRFPPIEETEGDVNRVATYIASKRGQKSGRDCIGFGRMRSAMALNLDVVEHFNSAPSISDYVSSKYPRMNETLFVKLRWNQAHCDEKRNEDGTVCIFSGETLSTEDYVHSIAYAATTIGASKIYMSAPPHVPEDVSAQLSSKLMPVDPVVLDVGSDFFTASVIEREMAVRSRAFVADGGAWGDTVQEARRMHVPHLFKEGYDSLLMVEEWRNAGSPTELPIMASFAHEESKREEHSDPAASAGDEGTPTETVTDDGQQSDAPDTSSSETWEGSPGSGIPNAEPAEPLGTADAIPSQTATEPVNVGTEMTPEDGAGTATSPHPENGDVNAEPQMAEGQEQGGVTPAQPENGQVNAEAAVPHGTIRETYTPAETTVETRPGAYVPPQSYVPSDESDHYLFPDGQLPERKVMVQPEAVTEGNGQEAHVHAADPNVGVVRIVSGDGGDNTPHQKGKGESSP